MDERKIRIYHHPNPEIKSFLTNEEFSAFRVEHFKRPLNKSYKDDLCRLGVIGARVVKEIMAIPGVTEVTIKPKEVRVKKEVASAWEDIGYRVLEVLDRALRKKKIKIVKG